MGGQRLTLLKLHHLILFSFARELLLAELTPSCGSRTLWVSEAELFVSFEKADNANLRRSPPIKAGF
jgi:hypothetical protein